eukprot:gene55116-73636_t
MQDCVIGEGCNLGQNVVVSPKVVLGPSMVFTNVINPRSAVNRRDSYAKTHVGKGA